jgi:lipopolysaccharide biosynthesis regulator YciM
MPTEATFLLAGLFIVLAATGWAFARYGDRDRDPPRISADYIRGLNLVLSRRTDEALELFIQMAKVDDDTLETHFALGHLFRRRGEVDRAIRVHQNLLARPSLSQAQRDQALYALAEDYLGAGLFDRAENLYGELTDSDTVAKSALERLVYIYEREREWAKAIDSFRRLEALSGEKSGKAAHYYCELSEQARRDGDLKTAREHLKHIARSASGALRGLLIKARIAMEEQDYSEALSAYEKLIAQNRDFISEVLPDFFECYRATGRLDDFERYIELLVSKDASLAGDIAYAAIVGNMTGSLALIACIEQFILQDDVLIDLIDVNEIKSAGSEQKRAILERIAGALRKLALSSARYRCTNCGYSTQRFIWHCPSCKLWETVRPVQRFQLESVMA